MAAPSPCTKVFISYSHVDKAWLERLKRHLKPLVREGRLDYWDDTHIRPGDDWKQEIRIALERAQVAVLLISADFFASDFIDENELPPLLTAAEAKGARILPVILSACRFARHPSLARFQAVNAPDRPLNRMPPAEQEEVLDLLAQTIEDAVAAPEREAVAKTTANLPSSLEEPRQPVPRPTSTLVAANRGDPKREMVERMVKKLISQELEVDEIEVTGDKRVDDLCESALINRGIMPLKTEERYVDQFMRDELSDLIFSIYNGIWREYKQELSDEALLGDLTVDELIDEVVEAM